MSSGNTRPPQPAAPKLSLVPPTNPISSMIRLMQGKSLYLAVANTLRTTLSFYRLPAVAGQQEVGVVVVLVGGPSCRNSRSIAEG